MVTGIIYNHPRKDSSEFIEYLGDTLRKLTKENKLVIISGDFNLDLLALEKKPIVEEFLNTIFASFLQPVILKPTRCISDKKPSLIDNIFVNLFENNSWSGNLTATISDHMPNFLLIDNEISKIKPKPQFKRDYKNFDEIKYVSDVKSKNLLPRNSSENLNESFEHFQNEILSSINDYAPFKRVSKRQIKLKRKPWITSGLIKSISVKNKLYKRFLKSKDMFWYQRYKYYRDTLNHLIRKSKRK